MSFSHRITHIEQEPFLFFYVDDFLPQEFYEQLVSEFPTPENFKKENSFVDGKLFLATQDFEEYANAHPAFSALTRALNTNEFCQDVAKACKKSVIHARGFGFARRWAAPSSRGRQTRLVHRMYAPLRGIRLEISSLPNGASIPPHTDSTRKVVSLLLYIMPVNWKNEYRGGTVFYYPKVRDCEKKYRNWENEGLSSEQKDSFYDECPIIHSVDYTANRLVGFVKTDLTYHAIPGIQCGLDCQRGSLNINMMTTRSR